MEKLIELLDKFRRENKTKELFGEPGTLVPLTGKDFIELNRVIIISKEYEFIKWLVENDKIKPLRKFIGWETDEDEPYIQFDLIDQYIAYLSIQDEPIRFLCEIIK